MSDVSNYNDILDVRDIIGRFEELEVELDAFFEEARGKEPDSFDRDNFAKECAEDEGHAHNEEAVEFLALQSLLDDLQGNGGDHEWLNNWYPITLIRDSYFKEYAQQYADDIGAIPSGATWPNNCIDWDRAASQLQQDYSTVEYGDITYWYR